MNVKTTIVLLVLLILCVGYVIVFHGGWFGRQDRPVVPPEPDRRLTPKAGKIQRLVLERPGVEKIVFVRRDGKWHITEPVDAPATKWAVDATIMTVTTLRHVRKYADDDPECPRDDLTHLSAPLRVVTFTDDKDKTHTIKVGRKVPPPPGGQTYVQPLGDDHVYVVKVDLHGSLGRTLDWYRRPEVAQFDVENAVRVEIHGDENYQLVKADDKWAVNSPVSARADQDKVDSLLRVISDISAEEFVDDNPKDLVPYGLDNPRLRITVELAAAKPTTATAPATKPAEAKTGKVISVAFGAVADKKVFAKLADQPWVFQVAESVLNSLQPKLTDIRDKHVLDVAERDISRIEILLSAGGSATLEKVGSQWRMQSPFEGLCDYGAVNDLIATLRELKAEEFQDDPTAPAARGLKPPVGKIVLGLGGDLPAGRQGLTVTLLLGRSSDSGQMGFVLPSGSKSVAVIPSADFAKLLRPAPAYWDHTILKLPDEAEIIRLDFDRPSDGRSNLRKDDKKEFRLFRPASAGPDRELGQADEENLQSVLEAIKYIRAEKIVSLNKTLPKRFAKVKGIRLKLTYRTPAPTSKPASAGAPTTTQASQPVRFETHHAELVAIKDKGKSYVWMEGASPIAVGELNERFYDRLAAEMRDRTVLKIDADRIVSFRMDLKDVSMEFVRTGDVWRYSADRFVKVDAKKIKGFLSNLSEVKAGRFADYSAKPNLKRFGLDRPIMTITLKTDADKQISLKIARTGPVGTKGLYATSSEATGVFILAPGAPGKMTRSLKDFQKD